MDFKELHHDDVLSFLPDRKAESHKGDYGKVLLLCGSVGFTGAATLAAMGALRSGAGLVYVGVANSVYPIVAGKLTEPIVFPLSERGGKLSPKAVLELKEYLQKMDAVLIGPGLGQSKGTLAVTKYVMKNFSGPVVVDADGINLLATHKDILRERTGYTILTPHAGEFSRLTNISQQCREDAANTLANELGVIVVLKGHKTVIADGQTTFVNPTGNPGMAVGGSGDVLAGIIVSLLGQGVPPLTAAACGVWLHGASGDICAKEIGQYGMLPSDMLSVLPRLLK